VNGEHIDDAAKLELMKHLYFAGFRDNILAGYAAYTDLSTVQRDNMLKSKCGDWPSSLFRQLMQQATVQWLRI